MKENGVDLDQQRHHRKSEVEAGRHSQTETRDHLGTEFDGGNQSGLILQGA